MKVDHARTIVVTGADSGLGRAVAQRLEHEARVIACGVGDAVDVKADLVTGEGRRHLVDRLISMTGGRIDAIVAVAGSGAPREQTVSLNFFGTIATLEELRSTMTGSSAPSITVVSSSSTLHRGSTALVRACLRRNEVRALAIARRLERTGRGSQIYRSSKTALNHWVRRAAADWAADGIVLNAVAPGVIGTDLVLRTWERDRALLELALPQPMGMPGPIESVVELLAFLASPGNRFMTGQVLYCDGGTDALMRGERPQDVYLRYPLPTIVAMLREARRMGRAPEPPPTSR